MSRIVFVNGQYLPEEEGKISIFDRGFLFADGVYEVSSVLNGKLIDNTSHLRRLRRSLKELEMPSPASDQEIEAIQKELISRNQLTEGLVYLQVTRGSADRDFAYPSPATPSLVMFTQERSVVDNPKAESGLKIISTEDLRWVRRDIKTVGLLASCMAKSLAASQGADDAWFVEDGFVTEGTSNNAYIVTAENKIVTRHLSNEILHGITRFAALDIAQESKLEVEERKFTLAEAHAAKEAFITSATTFVLPVVSIDGIDIGDGRPGPIARKIRQAYIDKALNSEL